MPIEKKVCNACGSPAGMWMLKVDAGPVWDLCDPCTETYMHTKNHLGAIEARRVLRESARKLKKGGK